MKLDLGCGKNPKEGFEGVDVRAFGQKHVVDLRKKWPWKNGSVDEVHCSHFIEHLTPAERIHFVNELYRVLKKDAKATFIVPHYASARAYGDLTHQWPPVSEFWLPYLDKEWRAVNAPHNDTYKCDFAHGGSYNLHPQLVARPQEYQQYAVQWYREACQDLVFTLTKK